MKLQKSTFTKKLGKFHHTQSVPYLFVMIIFSTTPTNYDNIAECGEFTHECGEFGVVVFLSFFVKASIKTPILTQFLSSSKNYILEWRRWFGGLFGLNFGSFEETPEIMQTELNQNRDKLACPCSCQCFWLSHCWLEAEFTKAQTAIEEIVIQTMKSKKFQKIEMKLWFQMMSGTKILFYPVKKLTRKSQYQNQNRVWKNCAFWRSTLAIQSFGPFSGRLSPSSGGARSAGRDGDWIWQVCLFSVSCVADKFNNPLRFSIDIVDARSSGKLKSLGIEAAFLGSVKLKITTLKVHGSILARS